VASRLGRFSFMPVVAASIVLVGSLVLCIALTPVSSNWAYFSLPTRAWQLAAGGILAIGLRGPARLPRPVAALTGWAGLALIAVSLVVIDPTTPYPGIAAAVPTAGTLGLIAGRDAIGSPGWLILCRLPLRWLGRVSYSLYLWHWPVLILGPSLIAGADVEGAPSIDPTILPLALIGASVVLAALSWRLVEEPFRAGRLSGGGRRRAFAVAAAALLSVTVASTGLSRAAESEVSTATTGDTANDLGDAWDDTYQPSEAPDPSRVLSGSPGARDPSSPPTSPSPAPSATPSPRPEPLLEGPLPSGLRPSLAGARDDDDRLVRDGCGLTLAGTEPPDCVYGDEAGELTVALVGDSHAMHWFPAFERLARLRHWRLVPFTKYSCVFVDMRIWTDFLKREYTECETWRERVITKLRRLKPDLVVITSTKWFPTIAPRDDEPKRQGAALAALIERIPSPVAILVDTPRSDHDVPACLARNQKAIERCTTPKAAAFGWRNRIREVEARRLTGAPLIDLSKSICPTDPCPAIIGRRIVYRDHHHLTATFAASLARDLDAAITKVLAG
jgi:SGNH domain (fused to AT3 domains)